MPKSALDAVWIGLRAMLQYKGYDAGRTARIINESYSPQERSLCHNHNGPKGLEGLSSHR